MKIFPDAPIKLKYYLITLAIIASTLYIDYITEETTNVIIFFICTTIIPLFMAAYASGVEGERIDELMGFRGDFIYALSMILMSAGIIGMIFFYLTRPLSMMFRGTVYYSQITVLYMPLSSKQFWFVTVTPLFSFLFYCAVAVGEEVLKLWGWKNISNWLYDKFRVGKWVIIVVGMLLSFLGWLSLHFIMSWQGTPPIIGVMMGIFLSVIFMLPYWFGEPIISPERGIQISKFSIYAPIGGHLMYDFLLDLDYWGYLTDITLLIGEFASIGLILVGASLLIIKYLQMGIIGKKLTLYG